MAQEWRGDKQLRQLEAMLIVMDKDAILVVSGTGEVIAPDDDLIAIGSGGNYALSAGRALKRHCIAYFLWDKYSNMYFSI